MKRMQCKTMLCKGEISGVLLCLVSETFCSLDVEDHNYSNCNQTCTKEKSKDLAWCLKASHDVCFSSYSLLFSRELWRIRALFAMTGVFF